MQLHPQSGHRVRIALGLVAAAVSLLLTGCGSTGGSGTSARCGTTAAHPCAPGQSGGIAGPLWTWGTLHDGPLGEGVYTASKVTDVERIAIAAVTHASLYAADAASFALGTNTTKGLVETWGDPGLANGELVEGNVTAIAGGGGAGYALTSDGTVWGWGSNRDGQLGVGDSRSTDLGYTAVQVQGITNATAIAGGGSTGYALKSDGTVWAWGSNSSGQLGDGTTTDSAVPVQVSGLSGATAIAAGLALKSNGTVWAWGGGAAQDSMVPVQVQHLSRVTAIAGDGETGLALEHDGTVWAWGANTWGQLGDGTTTDSAAPVKVKGLAHVTAIALGAKQGFALSSK